MRPRRRSHLLVILLCAGLLPGAAIAQKVYPTAAAAADAFVDSIATSDNAALREVLGADWKRFIPTDELHRDDIYKFLAAWATAHRVESRREDRAHLIVGKEDWTLPIPIVRQANGWRFDTRAGADEMRTRRIGRNELAAMQAVLAYYDAQKDYATVDRMGDGVLQYAQKFMSAPGKRDGLYWDAETEEPPSPLGSLFADLKPGEGYHGYRYKILKAQGKGAPGGAYDYVIKGRMTSGFALVAWPIRYGDTGVMSFMLSHDGQLYEKDLGRHSAEIASRMHRFDPAPGWRKVNPSPLVEAGAIAR